MASNETNAAFGEQQPEGLLHTALNSFRWHWLIPMVIGVYAWRISQKAFFPGTKTAPLVGLRTVFEPVFLLRIRFTMSAKAIIQAGYEKYKSSWYTLARNDRDVIVLSTKYIQELRGLPNSRLSAIQALISNLGYSQSELLLESDLHFQTLTKKITPNLHVFLGPMKEDLDEVIANEFPKIGDEWVDIKLHGLAERLTERLSARVFVGEPACKDKAWIHASSKYVTNASLTVFIMRATPGWLQPVVVRMLPCYWKAKSYANAGVEYLVPIIKQRREQAQNKPDGGAAPPDFLQGMMDLANDHDGQDAKLARRVLIMGLASLHLTTIAVEHVLYDIWARPEYVAPLRAELDTVLEQEGGGQWGKSTPGDLRKLDSFLRESQRLSPPSLLAMHRIVQSRPIVLSDGKVLPPGQHVCLPAYHVSTDPQVIADAEEFDGFRYFRMREEGEASDRQRHQFSTIDHQHLHFGVGHNACPGRWFASVLLKMIVGELLLRYDLALPGSKRPANITIDEFIVVDPNLTTRIRLRQ